MAARINLAIVRFALDLYRNKLLEVDGLTFTNPFRKTSMVGYNHRTKVRGSYFIYLSQFEMLNRNHV